MSFNINNSPRATSYTFLGEIAFELEKAVEETLPYPPPFPPVKQLLLKKDSCDLLEMTWEWVGKPMLGGGLETVRVTGLGYTCLRPHDHG